MVAWVNQPSSISARSQSTGFGDQTQSLAFNESLVPCDVYNSNNNKATSRKLESYSFEIVYTKLRPSESFFTVSR